jgi:hypothetical protein
MPLLKVTIPWARESQTVALLGLNALGYAVGAWFLWFVGGTLLELFLGYFFPLACRASLVGSLL